jgi:hypothetical protein
MEEIHWSLVEPGEVLWELKDLCRADGIGAVANDLDGVEAPKSQEEQDHLVLTIAKQAVLALDMQVPHHRQVRTKHMLATQRCKREKRYLHMQENAHMRETAYTPRVQLCTFS